MLSSFEMSGAGLGASAVKDGLNWGYAMWNPESDLGDVETWELFQGGIPYLSRKVKPNTPGHGKYRGGANYGAVAFIANSEEVEFFAGREGLVFHGSGGMHGGYPNATSYRLSGTNTNLEEIFRNKQDYPIHDSDPSNGQFERFLKGDIKRLPIGTIYPIALENYDIIHFAESGGPGYGDPLERKVESIKRDLDDGLYTSDIVNKVAGVVTDHGTRVSRGSEVSGIVQVAAVLGTKQATQVIQNNDFIEIICEGNEAVAKVYESFRS